MRKFSPSNSKLVTLAWTENIPNRERLEKRESCWWKTLQLFLGKKTRTIDIYWLIMDSLLFPCASPFWIKHGWYFAKYYIVCTISIIRSPSFFWVLALVPRPATWKACIYKVACFYNGVLMFCCPFCRRFLSGNYRTKMVCNSPSREVLDQQIQAFGRECVEESTESLFWWLLLISDFCCLVFSCLFSFVSQSLLFCRYRKNRVKCAFGPTVPVWWRTENSIWFI